MEFADFQTLINKSDPTEIYEKTINTEKNVLNTINRVIDHSNQKELKSKEFLNLSIKEHIFNLFKVLKSLINNIYKVRNINHFNKLFLKNETQIYVGMLIVIISLILFFIFISE